MSEDRVDEGHVRHVASLARVDLDEDEIAAFTEQFRDILDWFAALEDVPEVEPAEELTNVLRGDVPEESLEQAEALRNAADTEDGYFKGPPVG